MFLGEFCLRVAISTTPSTKKKKSRDKTYLAPRTVEQKCTVVLEVPLVVSVNRRGRKGFNHAADWVFATSVSIFLS